MNKRTLLTAAIAAVAVVGSLAVPVNAAVETTRIKPAKLERGPSGTVPHVVGRDLVDGGRRFEFAAPQVRYLGRSGGDYVVGTWSERDGRVPKVVRVTRNGERTVVLTGVPVWELTLSQDGAQLILPKQRYRVKKTRMKVWSAHDGDLTATRTFRGSLTVLDADESRMVLSAWGPSRTFWWNPSSDATKRISGRDGYEADIRADRLAVVTKDPYQGGCSIVSTLSDPNTRLWRSCDQSVLSFSPSGRRIATVHLLTDGLGPGAIQLRRTGGKLLARYSAYYFGEVLWESSSSLLMRAHGKHRTAWVRCSLDDCERTSKLTRTAS